MKKQTFIWIYVVLISISYFSSEIGLTLGGFKVNISDLLMVAFILWYLHKYQMKIKIKFRFVPEVSMWMLLVVLVIFQIPLGLINGSTVGESIRIVRNCLYVPITFLLFDEYVDRKDVDNITLMMALLTSLEVIIGALYLYRVNNWFMFYRANGVFTIVLFCYLFFSINNYTKKKKILCYLSLILLLMAMLLSQERTTILASGCALVITWIVCSKNKYISRDSMRKRIGVWCTIVVVVCVTFMILNDQSVVKEYINYYFKYRMASGNFSLVNDASFQGRLLQYKNILSLDNLIYVLIGRGTGALYLAAQGMTNVVDGMLLGIFKDLGLVGVVIYLIGVFRLLRINEKETSLNTRNVFASVVSISIFMFFNPGFMGSFRFAFVLGLCIFLKKKAQENSNIDIKVKNRI